MVRSLLKDSSVVNNTVNDNNMNHKSILAKKKKKKKKMIENHLKAHIIEIDNQLVRAVNNSHPNWVIEEDNWVIEEEEEKEEKKISQVENQKLQMS